MVVLPSVIAGFILFGMAYGRITKGKQHENEAAFNAIARNPQKNDVYNITEADGRGHLQYNYLLYAGRQAGDTLYMTRYSHPFSDYKEWDKSDAPAATAFAGEVIPISYRMLTTANDRPFLQNIERPGNDQMTIASIARKGEIYKAY